MTKVNVSSASTTSTPSHESTSSVYCLSQVYLLHFLNLSHYVFHKSLRDLQHTSSGGLSNFQLISRQVLSLAYDFRHTDNPVTISYLPSSPWNLSPGMYARPDGTPVYIGGREDFQKHFSVPTPMNRKAGQAQSKVQHSKGKLDK